MEDIFSCRFCPFAERTILVLLTKNIPFNVVNINLKDMGHVVKYKEEYIMESLVNSDFVDEVGGESS